MLERALAERERDPSRAVGFDLDRGGGPHAQHALLRGGDPRRAPGGRAPRLSRCRSSSTRARPAGPRARTSTTRCCSGPARIGHGLALVRHPLLMEMARDRGIAIEVCPISNQVLGYVGDLRAHPAVAYINAGIPVVLSPDDPG